MLILNLQYCLQGQVNVIPFLLKNGKQKLPKHFLKNKTHSVLDVLLSEGLLWWKPRYKEKMWPSKR